MTPAHALGNLLLASALEDGGLGRAAAEIGISRSALSDIIAGGGMTVATFASVARYLGRTLDETRALMGDAACATPHEPSHYAGGRARMGMLCVRCGVEESRMARFIREDQERAEERARQIPIREVTA